MSTTDDEPEVNGTTPDPETEAPAADADAAGEAEAPAEAPADEVAEAKPKTLAAQRAAREAERSAAKSKSGSGSGGFARSAKRYGPFVAIAAVVVAAVAIFSSGGSDDDPETGGGDVTTDQDALVRSGPMTPEKAELLGEDVDFGPKCDTETGRVMVPSIYAAPCVEPFTGSNGGATYTGVTEDEILVVRYDSDPSIDPAGAALVRATGLETNPETAHRTASDYVDIYNSMYELYGRKVKIVPFLGTGASDDEAAAKADAIAIADMKPFAVINGPLQSAPTFAAELASRGVMCISPCAVSLPNAVAEDLAPYAWMNGTSPDQAAALASELIGKMAGPGKATMAGDEATKAKDRKYALVHYNTEDGAHTAVADALASSLEDNGIELTDDIEYILDASTIQEEARTQIARLESKGITTVIFYGDPLMPASLSKQATEQDFNPEWILGPNLLADTAVFGRSFDQEQWKNGFGLGLVQLQGRDDASDAWITYNWAYGGDPPNDNYAAILPGIRNFFAGVQLAGPELTPETYRDGMFRFPVSGGYPSRPQQSWGEHGVWPDLDYGGNDDAAIIWWDPDAEGTDESGADGTGMYRFANGGERYTLGNIPDSPEEAGLFDEANSATIVDDLPPEADLDYPPPFG
jgi:hypothetical protein